MPNIALTLDFVISKSIKSKHKKEKLIKNVMLCGTPLEHHILFEWPQITISFPVTPVIDLHVCRKNKVVYIVF